jgi:hypothetical protein
VSEGEFKVSRPWRERRAACLTILLARSLEAQNGLPRFFPAFARLLSCPRGGATGALFRVHGSGGGPAKEASQLGLPAVLVFGSSGAISSPTVYLLHHLRRTATVMPQQKATVYELDARAEANGHQRGAHREEDSRRDGNKHEDKTKKIKMQCWVTV